jgi:hypothetical protein
MELSTIFPDSRKLHVQRPNMHWTTIIFSVRQRRSDFEIDDRLLIPAVLRNHFLVEQRVKLFPDIQVGSTANDGLGKSSPTLMPIESHAWPVWERFTLCDA